MVRIIMFKKICVFINVLNLFEEIVCLRKSDCLYEV